MSPVRRHLILGVHRGDLAFLNDLSGAKLMPGVSSSPHVPLREDRGWESSQLLLFCGLNIEQKSSILS